MSDQRSHVRCSQRFNYEDKSHWDQWLKQFFSSSVLQPVATGRVDLDNSVLIFFPPSHASPWQQKAIWATWCHCAVTSDPRLLPMLGLAGGLEVSPAEPHIPRAPTPLVRTTLWEFTALKYRRSSNVQLETKSEK